MNGKENIINKILADADIKCGEILAEAQAQAQEIADNARDFIETERETLDKRVQNLAAERRQNSLASAQLEARKYRLLQKQQLISRCYEKALEALVNLDAAGKKKLLTKVIENFAEKGEVVCIARADKDIVTQKFLDGFGRGLTLSRVYIPASGGLILEGDGYDKDLTLEKLVAFAREQTEAKVADVLFGD